MYSSYIGWYRYIICLTSLNQKMLKEVWYSFSEVTENFESENMPPKKFTLSSQESFSDFNLL